MKTTSGIWIRQLGLILFLIAIVAMGGFGCRTAHGLGEDIEKAGEKIQDGTK